MKTVPTLLLVIVATFAFLAAAPDNAEERTSVTFIGVALDPETKIAD